MVDDAERSQPTASDPGAIRERLARIETLLEKMSEAFGELKQDRLRLVTRDELHDHAHNCPPRRDHRKPRSTADSPKPTFWATAQQRLGVTLSALAILAIVGGAWMWTARNWSTMERQLKASKVERRKARREDRANLRTLLKKVDKLERKKVNP